MINLTAAAFYGLALGLVLLMVWQGLTRKVELLSIRNLYLAGFIVYQLLNPARVVITENPDMFHINDVERAGQTLLLYALIFIPVYLLAYHKTIVWKWLARRLKTKPVQTPDALLIGIGVALVLTAGTMRALPPIPVISSIAYHFAIGFAAAACGLVGWVWARRFSNMMVIAIGSGVFLMATMVALYGTFGRRSLLAVGMGLAWGAYYSFGQRLKPIKLIMWSTPVLLVALVLVSAYTAIRGNARAEGMNPAQVIRSLASANVRAGAEDVLGGQTTGSVAMWCVENFPKYQETRHLFSLRQALNQFIPRFLWREKPEPLATQLAKMGRVKGVNWEKITLPPGVLGYAAAEGGLYAVVVYALFFGGFCRFFDEVVMQNLGNPFLVIAVSSAIGHFLGLARGDLANFTINIVVTFVGSLVFMWLLGKMFGKPVYNYMDHRYQSGQPA